MCNSPDQIQSIISLTWPEAMQIYWNKRKCLHKKRVLLPQDWLGVLMWLLFHYCETPIWLLRGHGKAMWCFYFALIAGLGLFNMPAMHAKSCTAVSSILHMCVPVCTSTVCISAICCDWFVSSYMQLCNSSLSSVLFLLLLHLWFFTMCGMLFFTQVSLPNVSVVAWIDSHA